ncbi:hypothetical protein DL765_007855 [Monosporascus sp. GIB2]|nr:hypothetical protein DL765_007855 [Monosporascus sp. GIB2]
MSLADTMVDATLTFYDILRTKAETGERFELQPYMDKLTSEIIGRVVFDKDVFPQRKSHPIIQLLTQRVRLMPSSDAIFPWQGVDLLRPLKLFLNGRKLDSAISKELDEKIRRRSEQRALEELTESHVAKKRSIIDIALNACEKEASGINGRSHGQIMNPQDLPKSVRSDIVSSIKTFIFAGTDTTSSTLCWVIYLLHRYPEAFAKLKAELDDYLPHNLADAAARIKEDPYIMNKLEYTAAVFRETLRIFPPASTLRYEIPNGYVIERETKAKIPMLPGTNVWCVSHMIHRNKRFFPQPLEFIPERFIPSQTPFPEAELFTEAGKDAFRPFEKGPRNCIGQEMAMLEGKIFLALIAREFDFVLEHPGEDPNVRYPTPESTVEEFSESTEYGRAIREGKVNRDRVEGHRAFPRHLGSASPDGGCPGRLYFRKR